MLSGKRFGLKVDTIAIETKGAKRLAIHVPAESVITVEGDPLDDRGLVDVLWAGRKLMMFVEDIQRSEQVNTTSG